MYNETATIGQENLHPNKRRNRIMDIFNNAKKLGFGLMRLPLTDPNEAGSIDVEQTKQMVFLFGAGIYLF